MKFAAAVPCLAANARSAADGGMMKAHGNSQASDVNSDRDEPRCGDPFQGLDYACVAEPRLSDPPILVPGTANLAIALLSANHRLF